MATILASGIALLASVPERQSLTCLSSLLTYPMEMGKATTILTFGGIAGGKCRKTALREMLFIVSGKMATDFPARSLGLHQTGCRMVLIETRGMASRPPAGYHGSKLHPVLYNWHSTSNKQYLCPRRHMHLCIPSHFAFLFMSGCCFDT